MEDELEFNNIFSMIDKRISKEISKIDGKIVNEEDYDTDESQTMMKNELIYSYLNFLIYIIRYKIIFKISIY